MCGECENGCSKADLTVEEVIEPGTVIELECWRCKGSGEADDFDKRRDPNAKCWRCEGTGKQKCVTEPRNCPGCDISWIGGQISLKDMGHFGATHFGNEVGIYRFDHTVAYQCPGCGIYVSRFGPRQILTEEQVFKGTYAELIG